VPEEAADLVFGEDARLLAFLVTQRKISGPPPVSAAKP